MYHYRVGGFYRSGGQREQAMNLCACVDSPFPLLETPRDTLTRVNKGCQRTYFS
jgi:hypothetical protein